MKKVAVLLLVSISVVFPISVFAQTQPAANFSLEGYASQVGEYGVESYDFSSITNTRNYGTIQNIREISLNDGSMDSSTVNPGIDKTRVRGDNVQLSEKTTTNTNFDTTTVSSISDGRHFGATANMTSQGALGIQGGTESALSIPVSGNLSQTHSVAGSVAGPLTNGIAGSQTYSGSQTLNLRLGNGVSP